MNPLIAFLIGLLIVIFGAFLMHPKMGVLRLWKRIHRNSERVLIEDALKNTFDAEYNGAYATVQSIAGAMNISVNKAYELISKLEKMGLISSTGEDISLTEDGRNAAIKIVRIHRIWERYLADETSLKEHEWHQEAEYREHNISYEEANRLASQIGNPLFDPHGDPIPTIDGKIIEKQGVPLLSLGKGEVGIVTHIEDEPTEIFAQIIALGIFPGMEIHLIETTKDRVRFTANGEECVLAPIFAHNIAIVKKSAARLKKKNKTLNQLKTGKEAVVIGISPACRGIQRRRLMDFGIVPGTKIRAELESLSGDPRGYFVRGTTVAIRNLQAENIYIEAN